MVELFTAEFAKHLTNTKYYIVLKSVLKLVFELYLNNHYL